MLVVIVDDEVEFAADLAMLVESLGFECEQHHSIRAAREHLVPERREFIAILDHDFRAGAGEETTGYDLARELRAAHPLGRVLPIVYLSGRETTDNFIARKREMMSFAPDVFIGKFELATKPELLPDVLRYFDDELARFTSMCEQYGEERAFYFFLGLND
jgi:CheY-like chemotaxis protein